MIGIIGVVNKKKILKNKFFPSDKIINDTIEYKNMHIGRSTLIKFLNDKIFLETAHIVLVLEGVIFNIKELLIKYDSPTWAETVIKMSNLDPNTFYNEFRGSFCGYFYNKNEDRSIVFTDHIGDKPIYFFDKEGELAFSSNINLLVKSLIDNDIQYEMDEKGIYSLLTHGYMVEDLTPFKGIRRLKAGHYIHMRGSNLDVKRYHIFENIENDSLSDEEIINKIDVLFNQAVLRQVNKNKEYGYTNIAPLSAGLDSRMTTWVVKNYVQNILNITYSQANYLDEIVPKAISGELKTDFLFKTLDNGLSLMYLDEMVRKNGAVVLYGGPAQVWDSFHLLDNSKSGVIHTGMLGDVVVGTFFVSLNKNKEFNITDGIYSSFLIDRFKSVMKDYKIEDYKNQEIFNFYNRGFNGANMGSPLVLQEFTESYSPFYDVDFLEFCLSIPVEKRWNHYIYDKWVITKYPEAAKYPHNGRKLTYNKSGNIKILGKDISLDTIGDRIKKLIIRKIGMAKNSMETPEHMNPFDYWYNTNSDLKIFMDEYFNEIVPHIDSKNLQLDIKMMYKNGTTMEKTQVLTFLSLYKNYFYSKEWLFDE